MAVASQQITVKVDPLKEPKEEQTGKGERDMAKESWGGKSGGGEMGRSRRNRSATTRPLHKRYAACRRYADTFILTVMR